MAWRFNHECPTTHSASHFHQFGITPVQNRLKFPTAIIVYKSLHRLTPDYMKDMYQKVSDISISTKQHCDKHILCIYQRKCYALTEGLFTIVMLGSS